MILVDSGTALDNPVYSGVVTDSVTEAPSVAVLPNKLYESTNGDEYSVAYPLGEDYSVITAPQYTDHENTANTPATDHTEHLYFVIEKQDIQH